MEIPVNCTRVFQNVISCYLVRPGILAFGRIQKLVMFIGNVHEIPVNSSFLGSIYIYTKLQIIMIYIFMHVHVYMLYTYGYIYIYYIYVLLCVYVSACITKASFLTNNLGSRICQKKWLQSEGISLHI